MKHTRNYNDRKAQLSLIEKWIGRMVADKILHDVSNAVVGGYITERLETFAMDCVNDNETTHREMLQLIAYADNVEELWYGILGLEQPR